MAADIDIGKLGELLRRWGADDDGLLRDAIGGITVCVIPPYGVPPTEEIPVRDGWQLWLVGLGYPTAAYPTLAEAVKAELDERARIEEET